MSEKPSVEQLIKTWDAENNGRFYGNERPQLIKDLIFTIKDFGYTRDDIGFKAKAMIFEFTTNDNSKKFGKWKGMVMRELDHALDTFFPIAEIKKAPEGKVKAPYVAPEQPKDQPNEAKAPENTDTVENTENKPVIRYGKELDRSKIQPAPPVVYDKEISKLLGYDDE